MSNDILIKNRKASFEYEFLEKYIAGMVLLGSEIKSIREGKANIAEGYCYFKKGELWVKGINIAEYGHATHYNHEPLRERKLLLSKNELKKLQKSVKNVGLTIIPVKLFINKKGWAKLEIALAKGKKLYDKRESIKEKSVKRDLDRKYKV